MQYNPAMIFRRIGSECVVVPTGRNVDAVRSVYTLNESASFILERIKEGKSRAEVLHDLGETFDCDGTDAGEWLDGIIEDFRAHGIVL